MFLLGLVFGLPKLEHQLLVRLVKNVSKYIQHFQEFPDIYKKTLVEYGKWMNIIVDLRNVEPKTLKDLVMRKSVTETAEKEGIEIGSEFRELLDKYLYRSPDKRENFIVRYIVKYGFYDSTLFPKCELCAGANSRTHVTNDCEFFKRQRSEALLKIGGILREDDAKRGKDLERWMMKVYFAPEPYWTPKEMRELILVMKEFISSLYMDRDKKNVTLIEDNAE